MAGLENMTENEYLKQDFSELIAKAETKGSELEKVFTDLANKQHDLANEIYDILHSIGNFS